MYSPRIDPGFIPALYHLAKAKGTPMTKLVNSIIKEWMDNSQQKGGENNGKSDSTVHAQEGNKGHLRV